MTGGTPPSWEPAALTAFAGTLASLPHDEVRKAKRLYLLNAITEFHAQRRTAKTMLTVQGILCIIPIFLIVFIPTLMAYRNGMEAARQKILNAIEVWKDDLGSDRAEMLRQLDR